MLTKCSSSQKAKWEELFLCDLNISLSHWESSLAEHSSSWSQCHVLDCVDILQSVGRHSCEVQMPVRLDATPGFTII